MYNTLASFAPNREWLYQKANGSGWADCFRDPFYPNPRFLERDRQPERETRQHSRLAQRRRLLTALVPGLPSSCGGRGQAFCKPAWAAAR